jgi:protein MpaA
MRHPVRPLPAAASGAAALVFALATCSGTDVDPMAHQSPLRSPTQTSTSATITTPRSHITKRRIGTSVQGRAILAYRLGSPTATTTTVVLGNMHGNEPAGVQVARAIITGPPVRAIALWVVPTMNPDGLAAHTRQNAHGVDLNRNWSYQWIHQTGTYNSGPRPFSEPETQAMRGFLNKIQPDFLVSFHQPLHGVDSDHVKNRHLMSRLATNLNLPTKPLTCQSGVCHGTMTGWFNSHQTGAGITVEFGPTPPHSYLTNRAATGTVRSVLGHQPGHQR